MSQSAQALIIAVSQYPAGIKALPAVAADARELLKLLGSAEGVFEPSGIRLLLDGDATREKVIRLLEDVLGKAGPDDTTFVYLAGHGAVDHEGKYHYIPHNAKLTDISGTGVALSRIKAAFESSRSEKLLLWLDFCHSGGILSRDLSASAAEEATAVVERSLEIIRGRGKVIMCACTADQKAYEDAAHGHFTKYLIKGLQGEAASGPHEVTVNMLHDYIDRSMGSAQQRPMFFGSMTGRIVLMHSRGLSAATAPPTAARAPEAASLVVSDSESWVMLGNTFFESSEVSQGENGELKVEIASDSAEDDASVRALTPERFSTPAIPFAYRNDALIVQVGGITSRSVAGKQIWTVKLVPQPVEYGGGFMTDVGLQENGRKYSGDDIAELRARRLLLNDPPESGETRRTRSPGAGMLELMIEGVNNPVPAKHCVFRQINPELRKNPQLFLQLSRLQAIFALKGSQVFEHVLELRLGPLEGGRLSVVCRGRRRQAYSNQPAKELKIEGICPLD